MPAECDFITLTFRDKCDDRGNPRIHAATPKAVFRLAHDVFRDCGIKTATFWVAEPHRWRENLHVHGIVGKLPPGLHDKLFRVWLHRHGGIYILPANPAALPYVCKYMFKDACCGRFDWIDMSGLRCD